MVTEKSIQWMTSVPWWWSQLGKNMMRSPPEKSDTNEISDSIPIRIYYLSRKTKKGAMFSLVMLALPQNWRGQQFMIKKKRHWSRLALRLDGHGEEWVVACIDLASRRHRYKNRSSSFNFNHRDRLRCILSGVGSARSVVLGSYSCAYSYSMISSVVLGSVCLYPSFSVVVSLVRWFVFHLLLSFRRFVVQLVALYLKSNSKLSCASISSFRLTPYVSRKTCLLSGHLR